MMDMAQADEILIPDEHGHVATLRNDDRVEYWSQAQGIWRGKRGRVVDVDHRDGVVQTIEIEVDEITLGVPEPHHPYARWRHLRRPKKYRARVDVLRKWGRRLS